MVTKKYRLTVKEGLPLIPEKLALSTTTQKYPPRLKPTVTNSRATVVVYCCEHHFHFVRLLGTEHVANGTSEKK